MSAALNLVSVSIALTDFGRELKSLGASTTKLSESVGKLKLIVNGGTLTHNPHGINVVILME